MTTHDPHEDLGARLRASATAVDVAPVTPTDAVARGRQRQARRRGVVGLGAAGLVLAGVLALPSLQPGPPPGPVILDDPEPTLAPRPTPTPSASGTIEPRPAIFADEWAWETVRYGEHGIFAPTGRDGMVLQDGNAGTVVRALPLPDGSVANQVEDGTIRIARDPQVGEDEVLETTGTSVRLLAHREAYGELWWSGRLPGGERDEEHLFVHDLGTGVTRDAGVSAGLESFTDELAFDATGDRAAWLGCHLQCTLMVGTLDELLSTDASVRAQGIAGGWLFGVAISPDGQWVVSVDGPDPGLPRDAGDRPHVVVWDLEGNEVSRVRLPRLLTSGPTRVEFTPDGASVLVGDAAGAWVLDGVEGGEPPRELMASSGPVDMGAALTGQINAGRSGAGEGEATAADEDTNEGSPDQYHRVVWPFAGERAWQWAITNRSTTQEWQEDPIEVVDRFLGAIGLQDPSRELIPGMWRDGTVTSSVEVHVPATEAHVAMVVTVETYEGSRWWWVTGVDASTAEEGSGGQLYESFRRDGRWLEISGTLPPGAAGVQVQMLDGEIEDPVSDPGQWNWAGRVTDAWDGHPASVVMVADDGDGRVLQVSVFVFPGRDSAAG